MKHFSSARVVLGAILLASVSAVVAQGGAQNKRPAGSAGGAPPERYTCYQTAYSLSGTTYTYAGFFKLGAGGRYQYGFGAPSKQKVLGGGRYTTSAGSVTFTSGPLKGVPGAYQRKGDGRHNIKLTYNLKTPDTKDDIRQTCNCSEHAR